MTQRPNIWNIWKKWSWTTQQQVVGRFSTSQTYTKVLILEVSLLQSSESSIFELFNNWTPLSLFRRRTISTWSTVPWALIETLVYRCDLFADLLRVPHRIRLRRIFWWAVCVNWVASENSSLFWISWEFRLFFITLIIVSIFNSIPWRRYQQNSRSSRQQGLPVWKGQWSAGQEISAVFRSR